MTKEEIINEINCLLSELDNGKDAVSYLTQNDVNWLNENIKALEQEPRWIPVTERLPEESTAVLVWCPERKDIYCAYYEGKGWWIFGAYWTRVEMKITAWMPLPKPYKRGQEDGKA